MGDVTNWCNTNPAHKKTRLLPALSIQKGYHVDTVNPEQPCHMYLRAASSIRQHVAACGPQKQSEKSTTTPSAHSTALKTTPPFTVLPRTTLILNIYACNCHRRCRLHIFATNSSDTFGNTSIYNFLLDFCVMNNLTSSRWCIIIDPFK